MNKSFLFRFAVVFAAVFGVIFLLVWFYLSLASPAEADEMPSKTQVENQAITFESGQVQVRSRDGRAYSINAEIATTPEQQRQGLMFRTQLKDGHGMLFVYHPPRRIAMWMKNTLISLDMLFASRNGTIFYIKENAQPLSEDLIAAPGEAAYVLELPAGSVKRLRLSKGDHLVR
ncbi:MAG TPA: DUF192 domain-containing protein [Magnetovibrio sp.]